MPGILSQEEIDQLVSSVSEGKRRGGGPPGAEKRAIPYDFRQQNIIPKGSLHTFQVVHSDFAKSLSGYLLRSVKAELTVNLATVNTIPLGEFIKSRENPTYLNLVRLKPFEGNLIVDSSPNLVFLLIDLLFGGTGNPPSSNGTISHMERKFMRKLIEGMLGEFKASWERVTSFHPKVEEEGIDPSIVGSPSDLENAMMVIYELSLGKESEAHHLLSFCYSAKLLKSLVAVLGQKRGREEGEVPPEERDQLGRLRGSLGPVEVPVEAKLGEAHLTIKDMIDLQVGDIIRLSSYVDGDLTVAVKGKPKFLARPGVYRGKAAVVVTSTLKEGEVKDGE